MIVISSSLLPDLNKEQTVKRGEPIASFSYDNTLDETDGAMKSFQQRFARKRSGLSIAAYSLLLLAVVIGIIMNPTAVPLYIALAFGILGMAYTLTDKKRTRKKIISALKDMNPEEYRCTIYPEKIDTPLKTVFKFGDDLLNFAENEDSLLLIFNRRQIYCFPKRCLSKEQEDTVRDFLYKKLEVDES